MSGRARASPLLETKAMLDPASVHHAADFMHQQDFSMIADSLHGAFMHLSDAAAAVRT